MIAAERPGMADGLLLLSYPLHPPKKPDQPRTAFFAEWRTPALFVHGTRDPFGTVEELRAAMERIPARVDLLAVEGAGHDLRQAARMGGERGRGGFGMACQQSQNCKSLSGGGGVGHGASVSGTRRSWRVCRAAEGLAEHALTVYFSRSGSADIDDVTACSARP